MHALPVGARASATAPPMPYTRTLTCDAEEHAASITAWKQHYEQLSAGRYEGCVEECRIGPVQIFHERANQALLQRGQPRVNTITLALTQAGNARGWYCGHRLDQGRALAIGPNLDFELVTGAGMAITGVCVDASELAKRAAISPGQAFSPGLPTQSLLHKASTGQAALWALLNSAMTLIREQPQALAGTAARTGLTEAVTDAMLDCIAPHHIETGLLPGAATRRQIVACARDYMRAHASWPISVPDLCAATGVSRRALQYAFETVVHLSPVTYLRVMRLNQVRSELKARSNDTVGDIAARWGFWHPSRFAQEYRQLFGELPSETRIRHASIKAPGRAKQPTAFAKSG